MNDPARAVSCHRRQRPSAAPASERCEFLLAAASVGGPRRSWSSICASSSQASTAPAKFRPRSRPQTDRPRHQQRVGAAKPRRYLRAAARLDQSQLGEATHELGVQSGLVGELFDPDQPARDHFALGSNVDASASCSNSLRSFRPSLSGTRIASTAYRSRPPGALDRAASAGGQTTIPAAPSTSPCPRASPPAPRRRARPPRARSEDRRTGRGRRPRTPGAAAAARARTGRAVDHRRCPALPGRPGKSSDHRGRRAGSRPRTRAHRRARSAACRFLDRQLEHHLRYLPPVPQPSRPADPCG